MRRIISVLLAALLVFLVMASAAGALAASAATRKVKIKAVDSETGNAVCSVKVKIYQVTNPAKGTTKYLMTVRTDSKGIRNVDLAPGTYRIVAVAGTADVIDSFIPGRPTRFYFLVFAWAILSEQITIYFLLGTALILLGMFLADRGKSNSREQIP